MSTQNVCAARPWLLEHRPVLGCQHPPMDSTRDTQWVTQCAVSNVNSRFRVRRYNPHPNKKNNMFVR